MPINPYFNFPGNCREAVTFYAEVFGTGKPHIQTFGEQPGDPSHPMPEEVKNRVLHSRLEIFGTTVMFSDTWPGMPVDVGNNITLAVVSKDADAMRRAWDRLKEGGTVQMELGETFFSKLYGNLRDRFGTVWQFSLDSGETWP